MAPSRLCSRSFSALTPLSAPTNCKVRLVPSRRTAPSDVPPSRPELHLGRQPRFQFSPDSSESPTTFRTPSESSSASGPPVLVPPLSRFGLGRSRLRSASASGGPCSSFQRRPWEIPPPLRFGLGGSLLQLPASASGDPASAPLRPREAPLRPPLRQSASSRSRLHDTGSPCSSSSWLRTPCSVSSSPGSGLLFASASAFRVGLGHPARPLGLGVSRRPRPSHSASAFHSQVSRGTVGGKFQAKHPMAFVFSHHFFATFSLSLSSLSVASGKLPPSTREKEVQKNPTTPVPGHGLIRHGLRCTRLWLLATVIALHIFQPRTVPVLET